MKRTWGIEQIKLSPFYFNSLSLKYALENLKEVDGKILEIGCGAGAFARSIKKIRPDLEISGLDIDVKLVNLAKQIDSGNYYMQGDAHSLTFKNNYFNAVIGFDVMEHLNSPSLAFKEIFRVLKNGGVFHFSIPLEGSNFTIHGWFLKLGVKPKEKYAGHIQQFKLKDIVKMLKISGFSGIKYKYNGHFIFQFVDFFYFFILSAFKLKPSHTIEGYVEVLPNNGLKYLLHGLKMLISFLCFYESKLLSNVPGQIGHFTAYKK